MTALRLAFLGTPDFAVPSLHALAAAGHEILQVYSQPARPAGRGQQLKDSSVATLAKEKGWTLATPLSLKGEEEFERFAALKLDAAIVVAYGLILPAAILAAPRLGCLNVHASLLPRWRGAAPIQRAIEAGDKETGITIMQMDEGLDTGGMLSQSRLPITPTMTGGQLHDLLAELGARQIVQTLDELAAGKIAAVAQPAEGVTYAKKLSKEEARIKWSQPAEEIERRLRAFTPWPGAYFYLGGERIKLLAASIANASGQPGDVLDDALMVACGRGALKLERLQRDGRKAMDAAEFQRGLPIAKGTRLS